MNSSTFSMPSLTFTISPITNLSFLVFSFSINTSGEYSSYTISVFLAGNSFFKSQPPPTVIASIKITSITSTKSSGNTFTNS